MKIISISPRLNTIAQLVPVGSSVADIGTDHARLPIYLLQNRIARYVIATDVNPKPLEKARNNANYWKINSGLD